MTEQSYTKPYSRAPTPQRGPLLRLALAGLKILVYCWIGKAIYLFFSSDFFPYHGELARTYLALRDGFQGIPATLLFLLELVATGVSHFHSALVGELGYDPIDIPVVDGASFPVIPSLQGSWSFLIESLKAGLLLSVTQFAILFCILASGGTVGWSLPGLPVVLSARGKLIYWLLCLSVAAALGYFAFQSGLGTGVASVAVLIVCLRFPLVGTLPLWFLEKVLKLHPAKILRLPFSLSSGFGQGRQQRTRRSSGAKNSSSRESKDRQRSGKSRAESGSSGSAPEAVDTERRYRTACETFEITPGEFLQDQLRTRYRELMKKVHPDLQGSARLSKLINADYEYLLNHHGWKR